MELILGDKTYIAPDAKARMVRKAVAIAENTNFNDLKTADLDGLVDFTVSVYGNQFTRDDMYDELDANELIPAIVASIRGITGVMNEKLEQFPNA